MSGDFEEIIGALDLEDFLDREGLDHRLGRGSSGMQLNLKECPFCHDRRWRTYANAESGLGNCFVCSKGFNKFSFVSAVCGLQGRELGQYLRQAVIDQGWKPKRVSMMEVDATTVALPTSFALPTPDGQNLIYLEKRGIDVDMARYFHLRYCDIGFWNFLEDGKASRQSFESRVIIPVFDLDGQLVTFQGRDVTGTSDRKYLFPKMLPGTGRFLFNGQNALRASRVVMGEGAFDVIALKKALDAVVDLRDVVPVGSFGKHLSYGAMDGNDQLNRFLQLKRQGLKEVTIMWDGEHAALVAALDAAQKLRGIELAVKIAMLPKDKDPNEVRPEVVAEAYYKAQPYSLSLDVRWRLRNPYA